MKEQLAVIGANSMVGSQFCQQAEKESFLIKGNYPQVDITNSDLVEKFFANHDFAHLVLFSAFTDVGQAEEQRGKKDQPCWQINVVGVQNVAGACRKFGRGLIFLSTDFVFDGTGGPYKEEDETGPDLEKVSWYGITKIEGEKIIAANLSNYIIARIAYPYSGRDTGKDDLILRIAKRYKIGTLYPMYTDQTITPTYIPDIAPAVNLLKDVNFRGIIHLASPTPVTQFDFAKTLIERAQLQGLKPLEQKSIDEDLKEENAVPRPKNCALLTNKVRSLGFEPTNWRQGIDKSVKLWIK